MTPLKRRLVNLVLTNALHTAASCGHKFRIRISYTPHTTQTKLPDAIRSVYLSLKKIRKNIFGFMQGNQFVITRTHKCSDELATVIVECDPYDFAAVLCCAAALDKGLALYKRRLRQPTASESMLASVLAESVRKGKQSHVASIPSADAGQASVSR